MLTFTYLVPQRIQVCVKIFEKTGFSFSTQTQEMQVVAKSCL